MLKWFLAHFEISPLGQDAVRARDQQHPQGQCGRARRSARAVQGALGRVGQAGGLPHGAAGPGHAHALPGLGRAVRLHPHPQHRPHWPRPQPQDGGVPDRHGGGGAQAAGRTTWTPATGPWPATPLAKKHSPTTDCS